MTCYLLLLCQAGCVVLMAAPMYLLLMQPARLFVFLLTSFRLCACTSSCQLTSINLLPVTGCTHMILLSQWSSDRYINTCYPCLPTKLAAAVWVSCHMMWHH